MSVMARPLTMKNLLAILLLVVPLLAPPSESADCVSLKGSPAGKPSGTPCLGPGVSEVGYGGNYWLRTYANGGRCMTSGPEVFKVSRIISILEE